MLLYKTNRDHFFGDHFNLKQFQCRCTNTDCVQVKVTRELINAHNNFADALINNFHAKPFMTSGDRCRAHNKAVGGTTLSFHLDGGAIDYCRENMKLIPVSDLVNIAKMAGFTYYKLYDNHLHCDVR